MRQKYDVVIIGAGVAGALFAFKLSQSLPGLKIIILEAGANRTAERTGMSLAYAASINKNPSSPYNKNKATYLKSPEGTDDYYTYFDGSQKFKSNYEKLGGGSTWHWLGNVPRHLPNDFKLNSIYGKGVDWPIEYKDLESHYATAEQELGASGNTEEWNNIVDGAYRSAMFPMPKIWPSYLELHLIQSLNGLHIDDNVIKIRSTPQARNSQAYEGRPACAGNSSCVPICPIQAKYDATVHIEKAKRNGVEVLYESIVNKIEKNAEGKIIKVHFINWDQSVDFVEGKFFVLTSNAIESAVLLMHSAIANSSGKVGKFLMDHPQGYGVAFNNEPVFPFRGPPTTSGIDAFRDGAFRKKHAAFRISLGNDGWSRFAGPDNPNGIDNLEVLLDQQLNDKTFLLGESLKKAIENKVTRMIRFSYSTEMLPQESNRVELDPNKVDPISQIPRPKINFVIDTEGKYNQKAFESAGSVLTKMFHHLKIPKTNFHVQADNKIFSGAGHIMGTMRMGNHSHDSVVDKNLRTHDHENLFIISSGVFPTSGTANPTLTIAALAIRLAERFTKELKKTNTAYAKVSGKI